MNSWFSNFIIEEFRTDFIPDSKIKNTFMGTVDVSGHQPLPRLFEPKEITIDINSSYNQEVFDNDILIYNLDDSNLSEVEFVIRGLKNIKYDSEKILILISNVMTWAKTPVKTFTEEEIASPDFKEEEVPEIKEEVVVKIEKPPEEPIVEEKTKKEEVKKTPAKGKGKGKGKKGKKGGKEKEKEDKKKGDKEKTPKKSAGKKKKGKIGAKDKEKETKDKKKSDKDKKDEEEKNNNLETIKKSPGEEGANGPLSPEQEKKEEEVVSNVPKIKTYYYKENEYRKRIPNNKYFIYKMLENLALSNSNPMLNVYVICPGFIYGCGEDFFFDYFRMSWIGGVENIPIIGDGMNHIPTIHILDLIQIIRRIIERKPIINYIFACDRTKNPTMKNIIRSITKGIGSIDIKNLTDFDIDEINMPYFNELSIDMRIKPSIVTEDDPQRPNEDLESYNKRKFPWHCEKGIPENIEKISQEFNLYRGIKPIKIVITGPPCGGKTLIAEKIAKQFKITHLTMKEISDWAKNLKGCLLADEVKKIIKEMDENVLKAEDEYEHRKNKKKTDPPFDPSQYRKFSSEFVGKLLKEKLGTGECAGKGYVLDNYPKTYQDCLNIFTKVTKIRMEGEPEREVIKSLLPDSVIIIENYTEESLKNKLMKHPDYVEKQQEMDLRFYRRMETYTKTNEISEENLKILKDFYNENGIEIHYVNETDFMMNKELEFIKIIEYLERKGPIDNFSRLQDEEEILPFVEPEKEENEEE